MALGFEVGEMGKWGRGSPDLLLPGKAFHGPGGMTVRILLALSYEQAAFPH